MTEDATAETDGRRSVFVSYALEDQATAQLLALWRPLDGGLPTGEYLLCPIGAAVPCSEMSAPGPTLIVGSTGAKLNCFNGADDSIQSHPHLATAADEHLSVL